MDGHDDGPTPHRQSDSGIWAHPYRPDQTTTDPAVTAGPQASDWVPALLEELLPALDRAVAQLVLNTAELRYDRRDQSRISRYLQQNGVTAFSGIYADQAVQYTLWYALNGIDRLEGSDQRRRGHERYRDEVTIPTLTQFCTGAGTFHDDGVDVLQDGPLQLFALADQTPQVTVKLDADAWKGTAHRETRERSLAVLHALSTVCRVDLVVPPALYGFLSRRHPDWADQHLSEQQYLMDEVNTSHHTAPSRPDSDQEIDAMDAWDVLRDYQPGSGRLRLVASLSPADAREERDLARDVDVDLNESSVTAYLADLEQQGLVTVDRRGRYNAVQLTPLGEAAKSLISEDYRVIHPHQSDLAALRLTPTPQPDASTVCPPEPSTGEGEDDLTTEQWMADTGTPSDQGYVQWLGESDTSRRVRPLDLHRRLTAPSRVEGVNLIDDPVEPFDDGRVSYLSFFDDEVAAVVEWGESLPTLVRLATTLFSPRAFSKILTPSRVGDEFSNVFDGDLDRVLADLQQRTQIGWFSEDEFQDYDSFRQRFLNVRRSLLERLGELAHSDAYERRRQLYKDAHGFLTTATHLYRALGIDVNITVRFPDTQTLLRQSDIQQDFLEFVQHTIPKHAAYDTHSFYRHAFESREDKVRFAMPPDVDAETDATATATWTFTGPTITALKDDIIEVLASRREDEQFDDRSHDPIQWEIPVAVCNSYAGIRHVVEEFAELKGFAADRGSQELRHVVRILLAVTGQRVMRGSPYDVAEAMQYLASAFKHGQPIRVSDFEYALGQLPAERLFPDLPPSVGNIAKALLVADHPLGRSDILERAGISGSTYDRRISELAAFDFVSQTSAEKWTFQLSPWYVKEGDRTHPVLKEISQGRMQGVLQEAVDRAELTPEEEEALAAPDYARVRDLFSWLRGWMDVLETLTASIDGCREVGMLGEDPDHVQLGEPPPGRNAEQTGLVHPA